MGWDLQAKPEALKARIHKGEGRLVIRHPNLPREYWLHYTPNYPIEAFQSISWRLHLVEAPDLFKEKLGPHVAYWLKTYPAWVNGDMNAFRLRYRVIWHFRPRLKALAPDFDWDAHARACDGFVRGVTTERDLYAISAPLRATSEELLRTPGTGPGRGVAGNVERVVTSVANSKLLWHAIFAEDVKTSLPFSRELFVPFEFTWEDGFPLWLLLHEAIMEDKQQQRAALAEGYARAKGGARGVKNKPNRGRGAGALK